MKAQRLLKLADLLEQDAKNKKGVKFDLHSWGQVTDKDEPLSCGTVCCAVGLAAVSGVFKRAGLGYRLTGDWSGNKTLIDVTYKGRCRSTAIASGSFVSAMKFFDLTQREASYLFVEASYHEDDIVTTHAAGERAVAKRIRQFVAKGVVPLPKGLTDILNTENVETADAV
jgi:hypothetical protein